MAQRRSLEREGHWQSVIRKQQASGMSVSAFCRQHEVPESSFYSWKRKLQQRRGDDEPIRQDRRTSQGTARHNSMQKNTSTQKSTAAKFVPLKFPTPPAVKPISCEVVLPDGCRIMVPSQCDPHWLREIIQVVQERAC